MVVIGINGKKYDVNLFLDKHPGGKSILEYYNGYECGDIFNEINHSLKAHGMLKKYEIFNEIELKNIKNIKNDNYFSNLKSDKITIDNIKRRLNSIEDKYYIHKICGVITLLNIILRIPLSLYGISNMDKYNMSNMINIFSIMLLLLSSLNFHLPKKSMIGNEYYEYKELRIHSIIFSFRFLLIILINWINYDNRFNRLIIFICCHKYADYITNKYKYINNGTTIRGNQPNYNIYINIAHRIASIGQFISIICILDLINTNSKTILNYNYDLMKYDSLFHGMCSILLNVFMMTLNRKSLLNHKTRSLIYLLHISFIILFMTPIYDYKFIIYILISIISRFKLNINKYLIYISLYLINEMDIINYYYDKKILYLLFIISGYSVYKTIK